MTSIQFTAIFPLPSDVKLVELEDVEAEVDENGLLVDELDDVGEDVLPLVGSIGEDVDDGLLVDELDDEDIDLEDEDDVPISVEDDVKLVEDVDVIVVEVDEELDSSVEEDDELNEVELSVEGEFSVDVKVDVDEVDEDVLPIDVDGVGLVVDVELDEEPMDQTLIKAAGNFNIKCQGVFKD